jgi:hypothetical protein
MTFEIKNWEANTKGEMVGWLLHVADSTITVNVAIDRNDLLKIYEKSKYMVELHKVKKL